MARERKSYLSESVIEIVLGFSALISDALERRAEFIGLPIVGTIDFIQSNNEGRLSHLEQLNRFECLLFDTVHEIDDKNREIAQRRATRTQIRETLVTRRIDNE